MHEIRSTILSGGVKRGPAVRKPRGQSSDHAAPAGLTGLVKRQETRVTNHRGEDRHRDVVEESTVIFRRRRRTVRVVNVSSRGAMIESDVQPRIGESLDILLNGENKTRCAVRWVREGRIGIEFLNETILWENAAERHRPSRQIGGEGDVQAKPAHSDRPTRRHLLRTGTLYWNGVSVPVRLRNISSGGVAIETERELCSGAEVELDLGEAGFHVAEVRWSNNGQIGLRFATDFDLDSLSPAAPPRSTEPSPGVMKPAYLETELRPDSPWAARFQRLSTTDLG